MFYAYILKSLKDGSHYYGSSKELKERLKTHNPGKVKFTNAHKPYKIHYYETFKTRKEAMVREKFSKSLDGYN